MPRIFEKNGYRLLLQQRASVWRIAILGERAGGGLVITLGGGKRLPDNLKRTR
jgi:hypothetical protein